MYDTPVSASAEFYMENFRNFVDLKTIAPDNLLGNIEEGLTMEKLFTSHSDDVKKKFNAAVDKKGKDSTNIFYNL